MAISKQLVELHGGTIRATSPGENQGATFTVRLPVTVLEPQRAPAERIHPTHSTLDAQLALPNLAGIHVLVVDDEADARDLIQRVLREQGATVSVAAGASEALRALETMHPDVLVSDIGMPGTDGYQLMRHIRATEPKGQKLPGLALTAFARSEDRKMALLAGYQSHAAKPVDIAELVIVLAGLVGRT